MERLKELAAEQSGAINAREEKLFAANTRTYYPLIIPRREITTLSRKRARARGRAEQREIIRLCGNFETCRAGGTCAIVSAVSRAKRIPLLVHVWGCIDGDSFRFKPRSRLIPSGAENDPR